MEKLIGVGVEELMDEAERREEDAGAREAPVKSDGALLVMAVM